MEGKLILQVLCLVSMVHFGAPSNVMDLYASAVCGFYEIQVHSFEECEAEDPLIKTGTLKIIIDGCTFKTEGEVEIFEEMDEFEVEFEVQGKIKYSFKMDGGCEDLLSITNAPFDILKRLVIFLGGLYPVESCPLQKGIFRHNPRHEESLESNKEKLEQLAGNLLFTVKMKDEDEKVRVCLRANCSIVRDSVENIMKKAGGQVPPVPTGPVCPCHAPGDYTYYQLKDNSFSPSDFSITPGTHNYTRYSPKDLKFDPDTFTLANGKKFTDYYHVCKCGKGFQMGGGFKPGGGGGFGGRGNKRG